MSILDSIFGTSKKQRAVEEDYNKDYYGGKDAIDPDEEMSSADFGDDEPEVSEPVVEESRPVQAAPKPVTPAPQPVAKPQPAQERVSLKLVKPLKPNEAMNFVDLLKKSCIVVIDISAMTHDSAMRFVDFLSGAVYALDADLKKTNQNTLVAAPKGVDISSMIPKAAPAKESEEGEGE